ncbi:hypothetical protein CHT98_21610 (plasmid) [Azospirillum brasilense]|uniref:Uncharacterized protein n=1 Tax=Azospirillum brasilense TaxID=192 RepID=A0A235H9C6_AZOBR|nr:hypothetical protein CHT98_21610 [Azospirillum brasilense]
MDHSSLQLWVKRVGSVLFRLPAHQSLLGTTQFYEGHFPMAFRLGGDIPIIQVDTSELPFH